jgi:nucleoside-diphosphate-sugar epimerase
VRDVARLHVLAMTTPADAGQRFIGSGDFYWMSDVAKMLKQGLVHGPAATIDAGVARLRATDKRREQFGKLRVAILLHQPLLSARDGRRDRKRSPVSGHEHWTG